MSLKNDYENKMQTQLDGWKAELEKLKQKAELAETDLQLEYYTEIEKLGLELDTAHKKLEQLKESSEEKWKEFKNEIELSWESLRTLIQSINLP